jgi:hypothetical protein
MPRPRVPQAKAEASGAAVVNPARFKDRKTPKRVRPIGEPYAAMTEAQQAYWHDLVGDLPWLNSSHRMILRLACILSTKLDESDFSLAAAKALSSVLSKLGATPADETKVNHGAGEEDDANDKFFGPH